MSARAFRTRLERRTPKEAWVETLPQVNAPRCPVTLVCGCPGSGKTTYVNERAQPGDVVIDLDQIKSQITGLPPHQYEDSDALTKRALIERNRVLQGLENTSAPRCWFIAGAPTRSERMHWREQLRCRVIVLETPLRMAVERIKADKTRRGKQRAMERWATRWWEQYLAYAHDEIVRPAPLSAVGGGAKV